VSVTDYIPHGIVVAFAGVVSYVYREHVKLDDSRFGTIQTGLTGLADGQTAMAAKMADNHAEVLKLFIASGAQAATNAAIAAGAVARAEGPRGPRHGDREPTDL
jgi:autotransporter adhesin